MTPEPPLPETPPAAPHLGLAGLREYTRRLTGLLSRRSLARFTRQTHLLTLLLALLVAFSVVRTLLTRESPHEREVSAVYADTLDALTFTKLSYSAQTQLDSFPASTSSMQALPDSAPDSALSVKGRKVERESHRDTKRTHTNSGLHRPDIRFTTAAGDSYAERALQGWRKLAGAKTARAAEWRRYGIALFLFHRAGGLDAFRHILTLPPRPQETTDAKKALRRGLSDPFGHGLTGITPAAEVAFWETLYGTTPLEAKEVSAFRHTLQRLRLGWFENIALTQLYLRAKNRPEALRAARLAESSANQVNLVSNLSLFALAAGSIGWIVVACVAMGKRWQRHANAPSANGTFIAPVPAYGSVSTPSRYPVAAPTAPPLSPAFSAATRAHRLFPYGLLLLAFLLYMTLQETISLPLSLLLPLLKTNSWSGLVRLRFTLALQLCFYIPVMTLPLWLFRRGAAFNPQTGKPLEMGEWLRLLGFRTQNILSEIRAGAGAYLLLSPALLLMGALSDKLFHNFHTPLNPADLEMLAARFPLDKFLVFFVAAVAAPIVEETMFRGLLYPALRGKLGVWGAAALSAAIFSGVHPTLPGGFLPIWAIGFALALLYERRGSLWPGIVLHGLHNGFITLTAFALFSR